MMRRVLAVLIGTLAIAAPASAHLRPHLVAKYTAQAIPAHNTALSHVAPTPTAFLAWAHIVWSRLSTAGALPAWAAFPSIEFDATQTPLTVSQQGASVIHWPISLIDPTLNDRGWYGDYARQVAIHEFAHTMQASNLSGLALVEGGAQAWADEWAPRVLRHWASVGDSTYSGYVAWVQAHMGVGWVNSGQFAPPTVYCDGAWVQAC